MSVRQRLTRLEKEVADRTRWWATYGNYAEVLAEFRIIAAENMVLDMLRALVARRNREVTRSSAPAAAPRRVTKQSKAGRKHGAGTGED
jgi:hypothetical protein